MRHFLTLNDFSKDEIEQMINLARKIKKEAKAREFKPYLKDQKLAMIFEKSSTRTRISFDVGMHELGGYALFLSKNDIQIGRGEPIRDTARVISRMCDMAMLRVDRHETLEEFAKFSSVLASRDYAIAITRVDAAENLDENIKEFMKFLKLKPEQNGKFIYKQDLLSFDHSKPYFILPISSATNENIDELKFALLELLKKEL